MGNVLWALTYKEKRQSRPPKTSLTGVSESAGIPLPSLVVLSSRQTQPFCTLATEHHPEALGARWVIMLHPSQLISAG